MHMSFPLVPTLFLIADWIRGEKAEHKIQSNRGTLSLEMDQVPKVLRPLVQEWTPEGYIVSFKASLRVLPTPPRSHQSFVLHTGSLS